MVLALPLLVCQATKSQIPYRPRVAWSDAVRTLIGSTLLRETEVGGLLILAHIRESSANYTESFLMK